MVHSVRMQAEAPTKSFPGAAQKDLAAVRGYYRLIDQPAESAVTPENILAPHREGTLGRMQGQATVLCIQDGTDLNFAEHPGCVGLGYIGKNKRSAGTLGLHMHSTLVVNGEGIPLGVPQIQYEAPDGQAERGVRSSMRSTRVTRTARSSRSGAIAAAATGAFALGHPQQLGHLLLEDFLDGAADGLPNQVRILLEGMLPPGLPCRTLLVGHYLLSFLAQHTKEHRRAMATRHPRWLLAEPFVRNCSRARASARLNHVDLLAVQASSRLDTSCTIGRYGRWRVLRSAISTMT